MKLSIIAEGGAARGSYVVGVINALYHHFSLKNVDFLSGSSAGIGILSYYAAEQFDDCYRIWSNELSNDKVLSIKNIFIGKPFGNADYIIDEIVKRRFPLNKKRLKVTKTRLIVPLTNFKTGKVEYFDNRSQFDFLDILKASILTPLLYGKPIKLGNNLYCDAIFSDPLPVNLPIIKNSRKIIILTKTEKQSKNIYIQNLLQILLKWKLVPVVSDSPVAPESFKNMNALYTKRIEQIKSLESNGDIVIQPKREIKLFDNRPEALMAGIKQGYKDAVSNKKLVQLVEELKTNKRYKHYFED